MGGPETDEGEGSKLEQAKKLLTDMLMAGSAKAVDVEANAMEIGISPRTLQRARGQIGVHAEQRERMWWYTLPPPR